MKFKTLEDWRTLKHKDTQIGFLKHTISNEFAQVILRFVMEDDTQSINDNIRLYEHAWIENTIDGCMINVSSPRFIALDIKSNIASEIYTEGLSAFILENKHRFRRAISYARSRDVER